MTYLATTRCNLLKLGMLNEHGLIDDHKQPPFPTAAGNNERPIVHGSGSI